MITSDIHNTCIQAKSSTDSIIDYITPLIEPITKEDPQSWLRNAFEKQDNTNIYSRSQRSVKDVTEEKHQPEKDDIKSWAFDPKMKLVNIIRSFANKVEAFDG